MKYSIQLPASINLKVARFFIYPHIDKQSQGHVSETSTLYSFLGYLSLVGVVVRLKSNDDSLFFSSTSV